VEAFGALANENVLERLALLREGQAKLRQVSPGLRLNAPSSFRRRTHTQPSDLSAHSVCALSPECAVAVQEMRLDQMRQEGKKTKRKARKSSGVLASCLLASLRVRASLLCCAW